MKNHTLELLFIRLLSTTFLYLTAKFNEKECVIFFRDHEYMKRTKRFIPYIF